jgi:hypothetical protein
MKKRRFLYVFLALAALSLACSLNPVDKIKDLVGGGDESGGEVSPQGKILLQDDFSNMGSGWEVGSFEYGAVGYGQGYYFVTSTASTMTMWGVAGVNFTDVIIDVDANQVSGPDSHDNDFGVVCRLQEDGSGYYMLVSGDGYYSIYMGVGEDFSPLVDWSESKVIQQGNTPNHIRGVCDGNQLALYANGEKLAETSDATYSSGDIGLTATTYEDVTVEVHFTNLLATSPQ